MSDMGKVRRIYLSVTASDSAVCDGDREAERAAEFL